MILSIVSSGAPITLIGGAKPAPGALNMALKLGKTVVCADGGADWALRERVEPVAIIGDMDSASPAARSAFSNVIHQISEQDSTDFDKALRSIDAPLVLGVGFSGARIDHELGSLAVLARYPEKRCILISEDSITLLCPPKIALDLPPETPLSLFPMAEVGCESSGLHWATTGLRFAPDGQVGTLNKVRGPVTLEPDSPKMLLILPRASLDATVRALSQTSERWPARAG